MSKKKLKGPCFRCGAYPYLSNCPVGPDNEFCPDCGQCICLRNYSEDYNPDSDWRNGG